MKYVTIIILSIAVLSIFHVAHIPFLISDVGSLTTPGAPTNLVTSPSSHTISILFLPPTDTGGESISDYIIRYSLDNSTWFVYPDYVNSFPVAQITGLTNGQLYYFKVAAVNSAGRGTNSTIVTATPATTPGAPTIQSITPGNRTATLSWSAPTDNGGSSIILYYIYNNSSNVAISSINSPYTVLDLENGRSYSFKISAVNSAGRGTNSITVSVTPATTPNKPTGLSAIRDNTQVSLSWSAPTDNGGASLSDYILRYSSDNTTWSIFNDGVSTGTSGTITGLRTDYSYSFKISAVNSAGRGTNSTTVSVTPTTTPGAPTIQSITPGNRTATLSWSAPTDNGGSSITNYKIYVNSSSAPWSLADTLGAVTQYTISNLNKGTQYSFKIAAVNSVGASSNSSAYSTTPQGKPVTGTMSASSSNRQVTIQFDVDSAEGALSSVRIQKYTPSNSTYSSLNSTDPNYNYSFTDNSGTSREITITGLQNNQKYQLRIIPINQYGQGLPSNIVVVIPTEKSTKINNGAKFTFYSPPSVTSTQLNTLASAGLSDKIIPSTAIVKKTSLGMFESGLNQYILISNSTFKTKSMDSIISDFAVPKYTPPQAWNATNVFVVPPTIMNVTDGATIAGQKSVYAVSTVEAQKPIFMSLDSAKPIDSVKGALHGVQYTLNSTSTVTNFNMTASFLSTPPPGTMPVDNTLMYLNFETKASENSVNFHSSSTFSEPPKVSFTLGPQTNSVAVTSPTNAVNPSITCPQPEVFYIDSSGGASSSGISVARDTSGDAAESCGYTATLQHFSSYSIKASSNGGSGGSGGSGDSGGSGGHGGSKRHTSLANTQKSNNSCVHVPTWTKQSASWWLNDQISDVEFQKLVDYVTNGKLSHKYKEFDSKTKSVVKQVTKMWTLDKISDCPFERVLERAKN